MQSGIALTFYRCLLQFETECFVARLILAKLNACGLKHTLCSDGGIGSSVFVRVVDDFGDTALDECLGAFVTREECGVYLGTFHVGSGIVQDGIQLGVANEEIFGVKIASDTFPRIFIIGTATGHTVVSYGENTVILTYNAGADAGVWVLAPLCREHGNPHKILIPL